PDLGAEPFHIHFLEELFDPFGAHHGDELTREILIELALALIPDHFAAGQLSHFARVHDDESFEIENPLQLAQRNIQQVPDAARQAFEEPDMRAGAGQFNVSQTLPAYAGERDFDAALVANDAAMFHALVLAA